MRVSLTIFQETIVLNIVGPQLPQLKDVNIFILAFGLPYDHNLEIEVIAKFLS